ncbi:MAG TPA: hypothetical protein VFD90_03960 [Gaiellales bacterium]|nr:hypothetical protein [Gaiellales bacterium]
MAIYLQDHLAGSTSGANLARRAARHNQGTPTGRRLEQIAHEIEEDRETLLRLMAELGIRPSRAKNAAAWVIERVSRLKPNGRGHGDTSLLRMHELEALSLGIAGKLALWEALRVAPESAAIANLDLEVLHERARSQRERVEIERLALARVALSLSPETPQPQLEHARAS